MIRPLLLLAWLGLPITASASCPEPIPSARMAQHLLDGEVAFKQLDMDGFALSVDDALLDLPCIDGGIDPTVAARLHLAHGLALLTRGEQALAKQSILAARVLMPSIELPAVIPQDPEHPMRMAWVSVEPDLEEPPSEVLLAPKVGALAFDGHYEERRPVGRPTIAQLFDQRGQVERTLYLPSSAPMFEYDAVEPPPPKPEPVVVEPVAEVDQGPKEGRGRIYLAAGTSVASVGLGVGSLLTFRESSRRYDLYVNRIPDHQADDYYRLRFAPVRNIALAEAGLAVGLAGTSAALWVLSTRNSVGRVPLQWRF